MADSDKGQEPKITIRDIEDYKPLLRNPNQGTERGYREVEDSFREDGAGRSTVVAANDDIVAGNTSTNVAADIGFSKVVEVETDGDVLIVHKRRDWETADDPNARRMSYRDNTSGAHGFNLDPAVIFQDQEDGFDFSGILHDWEIDQVKGKAGQELDYDAAWQGMPEFDQEADKPFRTLIVHFNTPEDVQEFIALVGQEITEKTRYIFYPKQVKRNLKQFTVVDES